ncbi:MAG: hypothetical protein KDA62_13295 [Planctomycetales bacterium]|nr:hypothetical protein [Planctomycetales bacterium]
MQIHGIEHLTVQQLADELERGGRFVYFEYCISLVVLTFKQPTGVYFIRGGESAFARGLPFTLISFFFGWWGIPWGPIYTIWSFVTNFGGGKDVTREVLASIQMAAPVVDAEPVHEM